MLSNKLCALFRQANVKHTGEILGASFESQAISITDTCCVVLFPQNYKSGSFLKKPPLLSSLILEN